MTSAVTLLPRGLAQRSTSTVSAVETWQTCTRDRVSSASCTSRATMLASAAAGQPGSPSRPEISPSWQQASGPASCGSWACWATQPSKARTYSRARRISRASATQCPSSENTRTPAPDRAISPSSASSVAGQALAHRADRHHLGGPGRAAQRGQVLGRLGGVGHRVGVRHGQHRGEPPAGRRLSAGADRLGVLPAGLAQVGVQVDQSGQGDQSVGVDPSPRPGAASAGSMNRPSRISRSARPCAEPGRRR